MSCGYNNVKYFISYYLSGLIFKRFYYIDGIGYIVLFLR